MPNPISGSDASLSLEDAVGLLDSEENDAGSGEDTAQGDVTAQDSAGDDSTPANTDEPSEAEAIEGEDAESDEPESEELPAIEAPRSWNAEAKAKFAKLPRDVQEYVVSRESERDTALSKAQQEAAESRKRVETEVAAIGQYKTVLDKLLPQAQATFENRWKDVDWNAVVDKFGADEALKLRNQFEKEQEQVQQLQAAQQQAQAVEHRKFVEAEIAKLPTIAPDLADPKEGPKRRADVGKFLMDSGVPAEQLRGISALEMSLAYDAMRYRAAKANLSQPKKPAAPAKTLVKPSSAKAAVSPKKQGIANLQQRAFTSGSVDDMVALLDAEGT